MTVKSKKSLLKAIEMEVEGKKFYLESSKKVKSELARNIFIELASAEDIHIRTIQNIYDNLSDEKPFKQWITKINPPEKIEKVFEKYLLEKAKASEDDINALQFGLQLEDKSVKYYEGLASKTKNTFEKRFYLALSYEEREHYLKILDSIEYLNDPTGWIYIRDGRNLEG